MTARITTQRITTVKQARTASANDVSHMLATAMTVVCGLAIGHLGVTAVQHLAHLAIVAKYGA